jgi:hypothetical protein
MYNLKIVVLEEEWKMKMFEGSVKPLMKLDKFVSLNSRRDLSLKIIEFGRGFSWKLYPKMLAFQRV